MTRTNVTNPTATRETVVTDLEGGYIATENIVDIITEASVLLGVESDSSSRRDIVPIYNYDTPAFGDGGYIGYSTGYIVYNTFTTINRTNVN